MAEFVMPSLGADMDAGTIVEWKVGPGDEVTRGQIVAIVATDKADIDVEVFESGVVQELLVPVGQKVPVGTPLALIGAGVPVGAPGEPVLSGTAAPAAAAVAAGPESAAPATSSPGAAPVLPEPVPVAVGAALAPAVHSPVHSPLVRRLADRLHVDADHLAGSGPGGAVTRADVERAAQHRPRVSPRARRLARQRGVDLATLSGSGPGGAVTGDDVLGAGSPPVPVPVAAPAAAAAAAPAGGDAAAAKAAKAAAAAERSLAMRRAIAKLMSRSAREIPHYHLSLDIDLSGPLAWLTEENERRPMAERLLPASLLLKATALAARDMPGLNGFWENDEFRPGDGVHLGVAVALRGGGLITPAIHDADQCSLTELMAALKDLVSRARSGRLKASELTGGTITVTNLGDLGADLVHGVIYAPQVALVGFGRVRERPWAEGGLLGVRPVVTATLAADHRASDGMIGARFLDALAKHLQQPEAL